MREKLEIALERDYHVAKSNELIQQAINNYNITELKAFCYILSKVKPTDTIHTKYIFKINEFCEVCGINTNDGRTIQRVKSAIKGLSDKSFWRVNENGDEELCRAIEFVKIKKGATSIEIEIHKTMEPFVMGLQGSYTQYSLLGVVPMRSAYSIRLYELLKSYAGLHRHTFGVEELKQKLQAPYKEYYDLKRKAIEVAIKEINKFTDIEVSWEPVKSGRTVKDIKFEIKKKSSFEYSLAQLRASDQLNGQMRLNADGTMTEERV